MRVAFIFPSIPTRNDKEPDFADLTRNKKDWFGQSAEAVKSVLDQRHPGSDVSCHIMYTYDANVITEGVEWFATKPPGFMTGRWWYQGKQWSRTWLNKILDWKPDLIHWQMNSYAYTFNLASRHFVKHNIPYVYHHHGPHLAKKAWVRKILKYPHHHAIRGIYLTNFHEKQYRLGLNLDQSKNVIVPEGYDKRFRKLDRTECRAKSKFKGNPTLFWCGGINKRKDPLCVLEAYNQVIADFPEAHFYLAGYGPLDQQVDAFIAHHPLLTKQVTRLGYVNNEELPTLENAADIFVMGSHGEGFALASMEAMACGCFPVVTTLDGFLEQTQNGKLGQHFEPGDVAGCAQALRKAIGDVEYREAIRAQVPQAVQKWTWHNIAVQLVDLYQEILPDHP